MHGMNVKKRKGKVRKGKKEKFRNQRKRSAAALIPVFISYVYIDKISFSML